MQRARSQLATASFLQALGTTKAQSWHAPLVSTFVRLFGYHREHLRLCLCFISQAEDLKLGDLHCVSTAAVLQYGYVQHVAIDLVCCKEDWVVL